MSSCVLTSEAQWMLKPRCPLCPLALLALTALLHVTLGDDLFEIWADPPGSAEYNRLKPQWYDAIETRANSSFQSGDVTIQV